MPTFRIYNNSGDRCLQNQPSGTYFRSWDRFSKESSTTGFSTNELDMRRKAEVLQYNKNKANISTKRNTANIIKTSAGSRIRSQFATQPHYFSSAGPNSNVDGFERSGDTLIIPNCRQNNSSLTSESNVPGRLMTLTLNRNVPLTRYTPVRRTYTGAEGGKFPYVGGR